MQIVIHKEKEMMILTLRLAVLQVKYLLAQLAVWKIVSLLKTKISMQSMDTNVVLKMILLGTLILVKLRLESSLNKHLDVSSHIVKLAIIERMESV